MTSMEVRVSFTTFQNLLGGEWKSGSSKNNLQSEGSPGRTKET